MTHPTTPWWDTPAVASFRIVASRFISVIRDHDSYSAPELLHLVHPLLAELYASGFVLPVKPESAYDEDEDYEDDYVVPAADPVALEQHHARWRAVFFALKTQFGPRWDSYQIVFDSYAAQPEEPVTGSLADDLSDILLDLERGEQLWMQGELDAAVWDWRFGFESHWGEHVTGALRAIRTLAAVHDLGFPARAPDA